MWPFAPEVVVMPYAPAGTELRKAVPEIKQRLCSDDASVFWGGLKDFISIAANTERFLSISFTDPGKGEYMKGYIKGQRDLVKVVEQALAEAALTRKKGK